MTQNKLETKLARVAERKREKDQPPTKIFVRRLPPSLTPEAFLEQVSPLPNYDFFYFSKADNSLGSNAFTRVYIKFQNTEDIYSFRDRFDGYVFIDAKGNEYPAVVEYSPFQRVPKRKFKKADTKKGTIEQDPDYLNFLELLQNPDTTPTTSIDNYLEELENKEKELKANPAKMTPLIEYLRKRKEEKKAAILRLRDERKKRELERRKAREDERRRKDKEKEKQIRERDTRPKEKLREMTKSDKDLKKDEQPIKLLKNPEREKEKEKEPVDVKEKFKDTHKPRDDKLKEREKLRFSKENREKMASRSNRSIKPVFARDSKPSDRVRDPKDEKFGDDVADRESERRKSGRDERGGRGAWADRPRSARDDRFSDRNRSNRERDRDRERYRDDRPKSAGTLNNRDERRRPDEKYMSTVKKDPPAKLDKERSKVENKPSEKDPMKRVSEDRSKGLKNDQSASLERKTEDSWKLEGNVSGDWDDKSETEDKRKRRKQDRPERAIYDPRKAMERRQGARQQQELIKPQSDDGADDKSQKPKEKSQKLEENIQKSEEKGQKLERNIENSEDTGQKLEKNIENTEDKGQKLEENIEKSKENGQQLEEKNKNSEEKN